MDGFVILRSWFCKGMIQEGCEILIVESFFVYMRQIIGYLLPNPRFKVIDNEIMHPHGNERNETSRLAYSASIAHFNSIHRPAHQVLESIKYQYQSVTCASMSSAIQNAQNSCKSKI